MREVKENPSREKLWYSGLIPTNIFGHILNIWGKIFLDSTLVRPGVDGAMLEYYGYNEHRRAICKAKIHGCVYPGEAWYDFNNFNEDGNPWCHIITETGTEGIGEPVKVYVHIRSIHKIHFVSLANFAIVHTFLEFLAS